MIKDLPEGSVFLLHAGTERHSSLAFFLVPDGRILGYRKGNKNEKVVEKFYSLHYPPSHSEDAKLFRAICEFATAKGLLRRTVGYIIKKD